MSGRLFGHLVPLLPKRCDSSGAADRTLRSWYAHRITSVLSGQTHLALSRKEGHYYPLLLPLRIIPPS